MSTPLWRLLACISAMLPSLATEVVEVGSIARRYQLSREVVLEDGTRVDLLCPSHAIEVDWSDGGHWFCAVGQSLHYARLTNRLPGILLIKRTETPQSLHDKYVSQCRDVCKLHDITLWSSSEGSPVVDRIFPKDPFFSPKVQP